MPWSQLAGTDGLWPNASLVALESFRVIFAVLMLGTLIFSWPVRKTFFHVENSRGYAGPVRYFGWLNGPSVFPFVWCLWLLCCFSLIFNVAVLPASATVLFLSHHFFIRQRWSSLLRGMGAPGFMTFWLAAAVFFIEYCARISPQTLPLAVLTFQVDIAFIMISAGIYKISAGYLKNFGMELGLANPMWGYHWRFFAKLSPNHLIFWFQNQCAWVGEVVAGALMLIPQTRTLGGLLSAASFLVVALQIRLLLLTEMMMACALLFVSRGSWLETELASKLGLVLGPLIEVAPIPPSAFFLPFTWIIKTFLVIYLVLRPLALIGLYVNFFGKKRFPFLLQTALERYTNAFGIILWRVFTADVTSMVIRVSAVSACGQRSREISLYDSPWDWRFSHVGECIAVVTIFTTLKYYANARPLFEKKLLHYAKTLALAPGEIAVFKHSIIARGEGRFVERLTHQFSVDVENDIVTEQIIEADFSLEATLNSHGEHHGSKPGSYAPAVRT